MNGFFNVRFMLEMPWRPSLSWRSVKFSPLIDPRCFCLNCLNCRNLLECVLISYDQSSATNITGGGIDTRQAWSCTICQKECVIIRNESFCLCNHRLHEHKPRPKDVLKWRQEWCGNLSHISLFSISIPLNRHLRQTQPSLPLHLIFSCSLHACQCEHFFYIFAQGSFILKCRCKHKHSDHHPQQQGMPERTVQLPILWQPPPLSVIATVGGTNLGK